MIFLPSYMSVKPRNAVNNALSLSCKFTSRLSQAFKVMFCKPAGDSFVSATFQSEQIRQVDEQLNARCLAPFSLHGSMLLLTLVASLCTVLEHNLSADM